MSSLVFFVVFLSPFGFFRRCRRFFCFCFFFESSGSNRAHPHTHLVFFVLVPFVVPPRLSVHPFWPCVLFLGVSLGCRFGPHAFLGFSWYSSEALFLDARRHGCFGRFFLLFLFSPSVVFCGSFHTTYKGRTRLRTWHIERARLATGLKFLGFFFASLCLDESHRDPRGHSWRGGGAFSAPSGPFFTRTCVFFPAPGFFSLFSLFCLLAFEWDAFRFCIPGME